MTPRRLSKWARQPWETVAMTVEDIQEGDEFKVAGYRPWLKAVTKKEDGSMFAVTARAAGPGRSWTVPAATTLLDHRSATG